MSHYKNCRNTIQRFLNSQRVGEIGHVSCIDRISMPADQIPGDAEVRNLVANGAACLQNICDLLRKTPESVTASLNTNDRGVFLQVFLQMNTQTDVHYFATLDVGPKEHELWIEGSNGSLKTGGNSVWWRKRGWPLFAPVRIGLLGGFTGGKPISSAAGEMSTAILQSTRTDETIDLVGDR